MCNTVHDIYIKNMSEFFEKIKKVSELSLDIFQKEVQDGAKEMQKNIEQNLDSMIAKMEKYKQKQSEKAGGEKSQ